MDAGHAQFTGSIPELYDRYLGPLFFEPYARDIAARVDNWDLVDCSAAQIVGAFLHERSRAPIHRLAKSPSLWERRIAIIASFWFIRRGEFGETLEVAKTLLGDSEDLIHKAVGWMLREIGNRDRATEEGFLRVNYRKMPRTMLRYAIEKFPESDQQRYLKGLMPAR